MPVFYCLIDAAERMKLLNIFESQMFNPVFVNEQNYRQMQVNMYTLEQNERVAKVVHAFKDMLDQVEGMDSDHQQQAFWLCLNEMARRNRW